MKITALSLLCLIGGGAHGFTFAPPTSTKNQHSQSHTSLSAAESNNDNDDDDTPLLIRAARGETVERPPVWMMRQAGRHIAEYRELVKSYPTFRERSEIPDVAVEVSMQPVRNYGTDGCILFSDILTPLPGLGVDFDILEKQGPVVREKIDSWDALKTMKKIDSDAEFGFVGETLQRLRQEVPKGTAVLGFVGCPYTLATYLVEGKTTRDYFEIKTMMGAEPELLHAILTNLAEGIGEYACYQIEQGAQLIQVFDSWAGELSPWAYDTFAAPYQKMVLDKIKEKHPETPTVIYIKHSGSLIERMAATNVDIVSLDWTVDMAEGRERIANGRAAAGLTGRGGVQGNLDPAILFADDDTIREQTHDILKKAGPTGHVMNLGHGIEAATSEEKADFFIKTVQAYRY